MLLWVPKKKRTFAPNLRIVQLLFFDKTKFIIRK